MKVSDTEDSNVDLDLSNYRQLFLDEAHSFLAILRRNLSQLLEAPDDRRAQREARRAAHTLKGMAATMRYEELAALGKRMEDRLQEDESLAPSQIEELVVGCNQYDSGLTQLAAGGE